MGEVKKNLCKSMQTYMRKSDTFSRNAYSTICCHPIYLFWFIASFIFNPFICSFSAPCESQPVQSGNVMGTEKANWQETLIVSFTHRLNNNIISISKYNIINIYIILLILV